MSTTESVPLEHASPIEPLLSSRLLVLGNLLRRGAELRYERMFGLSHVEFGVVAMLGRRKPIPIRDFAALLGKDKAQLSRAVSRLVARRLLARTANPADGRDALIALTRQGLAMHDQLIVKAREVNDRLSGVLAPGEAEALASRLQTLIVQAQAMLDAEREPEGGGRSARVAG